MIERFECSAAKLFNVVAPAGYGKSALIRSLCERYERHAVVDCARAGDVAEFAKAVIAALDAGGEDALKAWGTPGPPTFFVFENAHALMRDPRALKLLGDFITADVPRRTIAICSRIKLPLPVSRCCAPHEVFTLGAADLRWDEEEAALAFAGIELPVETLQSAIRITGGWPVAVLLFARFAREGRLEGLLSDLCDPALADLHEYVMNEVLAALPAGWYKVLLAVAAIPQATIYDIAGGAGIAAAEVARIVDQLAALPGFVAIDEPGVYALYPILQAALRSFRAREMGQIVIAAARQAEASDDALRAAELYVTHGDVEEAAAAVSRLGMDTLCGSSSRVKNVLDAIPSSLMEVHLKLAIASMWHRTIHKGLQPGAQDFAKILRAPIDGDLAGAMSAELVLNIAEIALDLGCLDEAADLLARAEPAAVRDSGTFESLTAMRAIHAAFTGRFREAAQLRACIDPDRAGTENGSLLLFADIRIALGTCEWDAARELALKHLAAKRRAGDAQGSLRAWQSVILTSWLVGDDAAVERALRAAAAEQQDPALERYLLEVASGEVPASEIDCSPRFAAVCDFVLASRQTVSADALNLMRRGLDRLRNPRYPFLLAVGNAVAAVIPDADRNYHLSEARGHLERLQCDALKLVVENIASGRTAAEGGVFARFARRLNPEGTIAAASTLAIEVIEGAVRVGGLPAQISSRGLELLMALGLFGSAVSKERITDAIWPELDGDAALSALKTCVHRTRIALGDKDAIISTRSGYALNAAARVDVWETAELLRSIKDVDEISEGVRETLRASVDAFFASSRAYAENWAWFPRFEEQLRRIYYDTTLLLARDASAREEATELFQLGEYLIAFDPLDEAGYELRMRGFVASGDRVAAYREFRRYLKAVKDEVHATPSTAMCALIADQG